MNIIAHLSADIHKDYGMGEWDSVKASISMPPSLTWQNT